MSSKIVFWFVLKLKALLTLEEHQSQVLPIQLPTSLLFALPSRELLKITISSIKFIRITVSTCSSNCFGHPCQIVSTHPPISLLYTSYSRESIKKSSIFKKSQSWLYNFMLLYSRKKMNILYLGIHQLYYFYYI